MSVTKHQIELTWLRFCQGQLALILLNDVSNLAEVIFFFTIKLKKKTRNKFKPGTRFRFENF